MHYPEPAQEEVFEQLGVKVTFGSPYKAASTAKVEQANKRLNQVMHELCYKARISDQVKVHSIANSRLPTTPRMTCAPIIPSYWCQLEPRYSPKIAPKRIG